MRGWGLGAILSVACGGPTAGGRHVDLPPRAAVEPAARYLLVADAHDISEGASVRSGTALIVRAAMYEGEGEPEDGEPRFESLDSLALEIADRLSDAPEPEEELTDELARAACSDGERIPPQLRMGASVDVLGTVGWTRASITGCTSYQFGHHPYFAFFLDHAPEGAMLASIEESARAEGTYTALPPVLPGLSLDARRALDERLVELGLTGAFLSASPEDVGTFELPDGRALVHVGVPMNDAEEEGTVGRGACWTAGACGATVILAFDGPVRTGSPSARAVIVHGSSDEEVSAELDGEEGGVWNVAGVFRDGSAWGLVSVFETLGTKLIVVTRWRDDVREDQTIYLLEYG